MKKTLIAALAVAAALPLAACGSHDATDTSNTALAANEVDTLGVTGDNVTLADENAFAIANEADATANATEAAADNLVAGNAL